MVSVNLEMIEELFYAGIRGFIPQNFMGKLSYIFADSSMDKFYELFDYSVRKWVGICRYCLD